MQNFINNVCVYVHMSTKTISIMEDVYDILNSNKMPEESFSEVIRRLVSKKNDISEFAGAWKDVDTDFIKNTIKKIKKNNAEKYEAMVKSFV